MNKKLLLLLLCLLMADPSVAADKHKRKGKRVRNRILETGASCINQIPSTEDFTDSYWTNVNLVYGLHEDGDGPYAGTYAQKFSGDGVNGSPFLYRNGSGLTFGEDNVYSVFVKRGNSSQIRISLYRLAGGVHCLGQFDWSVDQFVDNTSDIDVDDSGVIDLGNGWFRVWIYVDADADGWVGDDVRPYIWPVQTGIHTAGNWIYGANLTHAGSTPCVAQSSGPRVYPSLVLKRGVPNDFWYNNQFLDNGTPADGYSDGLEFESITSPAHLYYWDDDMMDLERAWGITTSSDVGIVVIDQEISTPHYDLNANIFKNTNEIPENGIDDDNNGLIDDYEGWDFTSWDHRPYINGYEDNFALAIANGSQHGTQMASLIGAVGNNENWIGVPDINTKRQGSVGVLWDVPILAASSIGASGKTNVGINNTLHNTYQSLAFEYAKYLNDNGANFKVFSESYLGQSTEDSYQAKFYDLMIVAGAGNTNSTSAQTWSTGDHVIIPGAVRYDGKTGNRDQSGTGVQDGSTSFGSNVTLCGYGSNSYWYNWGQGKFITPPPANGHMFTLGYLDPETTVGSLIWQGNINTNGQSGQPVYGILPTPSWTSGATAQAAALASMTWGMYPDISAEQVHGMMQRGSITDIYDGRNVDQCNDGDCDGLLGTGRMSAYRTITLWGAVGDTTLTGDVYVSGDVVFTGTTFLNSVTFHIAPYDLYQNEIDNGTLTCQSQYDIDYTGYASSSADEICIYITGNTFSNSGHTNIFKSNAEYPQTQDWGGIYTEGAGNFFLLGTTIIENTQTGEF